MDPAAAVERKGLPDGEDAAALAQGAAEAPIPTAGGARAALKRHGPKLLLSILLGGGLAWVLSRGGLPLVPSAASFASLRPWTVPVYVLSLALVHFLRAIRWRHLLRPIAPASARAIVAVSFIGFGAIVLSPLRAGEIVRPYLITRRSRVRLWEAAGTVGAERVIDGLLLSLILLGAMLLSTPLDPLPDHVGALPVPAAAVRPAIYTALALFFSAFAAMALFYFARDLARRLTHAVVGVVSHELADRLATVVERVAEGIRFLPSPGHVLPFLGETLAYWGVNAAGIWLIAWGAGLSGISLAESAVTMGCIGIGILVPSGPGYFGAFQLSAYMALALYFPARVLEGPGAALVFLLYVSQVGFHLVGILIGLALDRAPAAVPEPAAAPAP
ncbi:MAG: lysylphosphatidylglycerol synthase transmembrane domain-containing protein [Byssovorax sp.]